MSEMTDAYVKLDKVSKIYHIGEQEVRALDEASMYVKKMSL